MFVLTCSSMYSILYVTCVVYVLVYIYVSMYKCICMCMSVYVCTWISRYRVVCISGAYVYVCVSI